MAERKTIYLDDAMDAIRKDMYADRDYMSAAICDGIEDVLNSLPSAQPNIKQAAKLLSDFIDSCPGGDSYLITPNGEELRTDWGYALEGIQLIRNWAERRSDG